MSNALLHDVFPAAHEALDRQRIQHFICENNAVHRCRRRIQPGDETREVGHALAQAGLLTFAQVGGHLENIVRSRQRVQALDLPR